MLHITPAAVFWAACLVQVFGLATLAAARWRGRCPECPWLQGALFLAMGLLGCVAMWAYEVGSGSWAACGATLSIMAVGATMDLPAAAPAREG